MRIGKLLSWPAPKEWIGHTAAVLCTSYSPNGIHVVTGASDHTIRIWDSETGVVTREALVGHEGGVTSVAYSPDGRYITSGSSDMTIRIWDAETGSVVRRPLVGHNRGVMSVACSPDGRHIISGSLDNTIRIWDADTGAAAKKPLEGHIESTQTVTYSPDPQHTASGVSGNITQVRSQSPQVSIQHSFQIYAHLCTPPNSEGWVTDLQGALLYWVPPDCRLGLHSPALLTIPLTSHFRSVSLNFEDFAFGTSWTQIFNTA